jgi:hypothetical protein
LTQVHIFLVENIATLTTAEQEMIKGAIAVCQGNLREERCLHGASVQYLEAECLTLDI